MSDVLDYVREKDPRFKDVGDDDLTLYLADKKPDFLKDDAFKAQFQGVIAKKGLEAVQSGVSGFLRTLTNPAAGEAAQAGRDQTDQANQDEAFRKSIGAQEQPARSGEERAAQGVATLRGTTFDPLRDHENQIRPQTLGERVDSTLQQLPLIGKAFTATKLPYEIDKEKGIPEKQSIANAIRDLVGGIWRPESIALLATGAGEAQIAKLSPKLALSIRQAISAYFAAGGVQATAEGLTEAMKPGKTLSERAGSLLSAGGGAAIAVGAAHGMTADRQLVEAAAQAAPVAPMTAAAVISQPAILETAKKTPEHPDIADVVLSAHPEIAGQKPASVSAGEHLAELGWKPEDIEALTPAQRILAAATFRKPPEPPALPQEPLGGVQTPSAPETPAAPVKAAESAPSEQITAASYTHPETGEATTGRNHIEAAKEQGVEAPRPPTERHGPEYGYEVQNPETGDTRIVSRDEGLDVARKSGQLLNEPTLGKLHSNEIWHAIPFEKRTRLKELGLTNKDIADLESGKERAGDIATRLAPEDDLDTVADTANSIDEILQEKRKQNAVQEQKPSAEVLRDEGPQVGLPPVGARDAESKEAPGAQGVSNQGSESVSQKASELTTGQLPKVAEAAKEAPRVAQALSGTKRFDAETQLNGPDILSWMRDNMKMLSKSAARLKWGRAKFRENQSLYDDAAVMQSAHHNLVFSDKGSTPDVVAQTAFNDRVLSEPSVNVLHEAMDQASKARAGAVKTAGREQKFLEEDTKQHTDWLAATKEGEKRISADQLKKGDLLEVDGERVEVTDVDADGNVELKDGRKFGTQKLQEGQTIHVQKFDPAPEDEATFGPTDAAPEAEPITEKPAQAEEQAAAPKPKAVPVAEVEKLRATENGGRIAIVLPDGKAVVGGRIHADTWMKAVNAGVATDAELADGFAGFVKPDGTAWGVNGKSLPKVSEIYVVGDEIPKPPARPHQRPPEPAPTTPKLGAMEKGTGDLLKGIDEEFSLTGEKGSDADRITAEKSKAEQTALEAKAIEAKQQQELGVGAPKEREGLLQKQSRLYSDLGTNLNDWLRDATKEQVLEKYRLASEMGPEIDAEIALRKQLGEDDKALNPLRYDVDHLRAVMEHKLMTDFKEEGAAPEPSGSTPEAVKERGKVRLKGQGPQTYTVTEHIPATEVEIANGEQMVRVKNDKTGAETIVLEGQLQDVRERSAEEREATRGMTRKELDDELRRVNLDPAAFTNAKEKRAALKRQKEKDIGKGPGAMGSQQPFDPNKLEQLEQLTQALKDLKGRKVTFREKVKEAFAIGEKLSAAKDAASRALAGFKASGDYIIKQWEGYDTLDDMLRAKGALSGELEKRGVRARQFAKQELDAIPDKAERAAITKWVDANGNVSELLWGANHTKPEYRQAYIDAIHLSGDKLTVARNIQSYFEARLDEAIDAGILDHGVEDFIHRIFEKDPAAAKAVNAYVQSGILARNPGLAKKRIFQMDWEAERLGYKVVQDFVPRITDYESALSRAIAARGFIRKMVGFTDDTGAKIKGMLAPDGRPVIDVAGLGIPVEDQAGVREATLINPSFKPEEAKKPANKRNPLNERGDYKERPEYSALKKWKWVSEDAGGKPIYVQGNVLVHPDFVGRIDDLLKPSSVRNAQKPVTRTLLRAALNTSSTVKQTMLDFSGFHQVQELVHGAEHGVWPWKIIKDIDFTHPDVDGLLSGGVTLGGEYRTPQSEGLIGGSISRMIPGVSTIMKTYHDYLFQSFIPRLKMSMALHAIERNKARFAGDVAAGRMTMDEIYHRTANEANAAFGGLNYTMLERSKTAQDISRIVLLAPDFLEARGRFVAQAFKRGGGDMKTAEYWKRGGPLTSNEQRQALLLGALTMYALARVGNYLISGQYHMEPENAFSWVINGKAYGLRTVQGDVLHLFEQPVQFWMSRLNPVFGRTMLEMATGRDYFGRKRSALEQLWDGVSTVTPVSLRFGRERHLMESLANGLGITARRYNDADQAFKMAQKWKDKNGIQNKGEFIYDSDKDPLRPLKLALANGDEAGATKELLKLKKGKSKYNTDYALNQYFNHYAEMNFTGSFENDKKFIASLSDDDKKTVAAAKEAKRGMRTLYFKANAKTVPSKVVPDRRPAQKPGQDVPIPKVGYQPIE